MHKAGFFANLKKYRLQTQTNIMNADWNDRAKTLLKTQLHDKGISNETLVDYLSVIGVKETKASIDSKISRGTFSAAFLIQCLSAIGSRSINIPTQSSSERNNPISSKQLDEPIFCDRNSNTKYIDISALPTPDNTRRLTVISLFSGAGGLDIGLEEAGFECLVCVDNDKHCRETLKYNRPEWTVFESTETIVNGKAIPRDPGNIRDISANDLLKAANVKKGEVSLVVGGAPCQPFSNIGMKRGKDDEKNGDLFLEFVRIIKGIEPQAFIFENVAGITQKKHAAVIRYMKDQFHGMNYGMSHTILNAANYGVGQRRERFFLIGIKGVDNPAFPLPTHFKDERSWKVFTKDFDRAPFHNPESWVTVKDVLNSIPKSYKSRKDYAVMGISKPVLKRMKYVKQGENFKVLPMKLRPNCWKNGKHLGSDTFGRLVEDLPSVTIRTAAYNPSKGRYIHPFEDRGLDIIEMAAIQGFPYEWVFRCEGRDTITLVSGGRQIGNAVPPPLAMALGKAIREQLPVKIQAQGSLQTSHELVEAY